MYFGTSVEIEIRAMFSLASACERPSPVQCLQPDYCFHRRLKTRILCIE